MIFKWNRRCGHCKRMKPQFVEAAAAMKEDGIAGRLAAVDCTAEHEVAKRCVHNLSDR